MKIWKILINFLKKWGKMIKIYIKKYQFQKWGIAGVAIIFLVTYINQVQILQATDLITIKIKIKIKKLLSKKIYHLSII
jgi:hypothetical protein